MSSERITSIQNSIKMIDGNYEDVAINARDYNWLIEQAVRLHGTEHRMGILGMYEDCNRTVGDNSMKFAVYEEHLKLANHNVEKERELNSRFRKDISRLEEQNKVYREFVINVINGEEDLEELARKIAEEIK